MNCLPNNRNKHAHTHACFLHAKMHTNKIWQNVSWATELTVAYMQLKPCYITLQLAGCMDHTHLVHFQSSLIKSADQTGMRGWIRTKKKKSAWEITRQMGGWTDRGRGRWIDRCTDWWMNGSVKWWTDNGKMAGWLDGWLSWFRWEILSNQGMSEVITERKGKIKMDSRKDKEVIRKPPREGRVADRNTVALWSFWTHIL